ncbi:MAG: hypothetical protein AYK19_12065 [Theionarchaea archaeon DG-70-1]|nr:MAG: hypothetical protein AYK19_12065 [Theionarchaea archaeon DG-70-1]
MSREQLESIRLARAELHSAAREIERQLTASEITRDEAAAALEALREGFVAQLQEILTPEQWELFLEIRNRRGMTILFFIL